MKSVKNLSCLILVLASMFFLKDGFAYAAEKNINPVSGQQTIIGTVSSVSGTTLLFNAKLNNAPYTVYTKNAKIAQFPGLSTMTGSFKTDIANSKATTLAAIKAGDIVAVSGAISDSSITATFIRIMPPPDYFGKITAVNGVSFTLEKNGISKNQTQPIYYTVNTTASTIFRKGKDAASISDVVADKMATVSGTLDSVSNIISATAVVISSPPQQIQKKYPPAGKNIFGASLSTGFSNVWNSISTPFKDLLEKLFGK